jgi:hypothetical protein
LPQCQLLGLADRGALSKKKGFEMGRTSRRQILSMTAMAATGSAIGCNSSNVIDPITKSVDSAADGIQGAVESTSTSDLKRYKIALRGYQFVSMYIAGRVVFLPYPGMRILSVIIVATSVAAKLTVEYIDDELIQRKVEESLTSNERSKIESDRYVTFTTESGIDTKEYLSPTMYSNE